MNTAGPLHASDECTGNWILDADLVDTELGTVPPSRRYVRCLKCGIRWAPTDENKRLAISENYAGMCLNRLATEGAALLRSQS